MVAELEPIFNTPSHHRVHHGSNPQYIDKNYGAVFIIWDRLFGTFQKEEEPVVYGLTKNINTYNPVLVLFYGWITLFKEVVKARSWKQAFGLVFGHPGLNLETEASKVPD